MSTERRRDIDAAIHTAMRKPLDIDWTRESPAITEAVEQLNEAIALYREGKISKAEVKTAYSAFRDAHKGGLF